MKLSSKIFGVIGVQVIIALLVMGLGLYGLTHIGSAFNNYIRLSTRSVALAEIDKIALQLAVAEKNLILSIDDAAVKAVTDSDAFKNALPKIREQINIIKTTIKPSSAAWAREIPAQLETLAKKYDDATEEVASLARLKTDQKALEEYEASQPFWNEYIEAAGPVFSAVEKE